MDIVCGNKLKKKNPTVGTVPTWNIKMAERGKTCHTVGTFSKSNIKIAKRGNIDTSNTQINDRSLSDLGTGTSIKQGWVKLVLWP